MFLLMFIGRNYYFFFNSHSTLFVIAVKTRVSSLTEVEFRWNMDLFDSLKYIIYGQQFFRLASLRLDKASNLLYTSNLDVVNSLIYIAAFSTQIGFVVQKLFADTSESDVEGSFYQFNVGERARARVSNRF